MLKRDNGLTHHAARSGAHRRSNKAGRKGMKGLGTTGEGFLIAWLPSEGES
jgi:hypothetical protein